MRRFLLPVLIACAALAGPARAQDDEAERSGFVRYVEDTISTPNRKIRLGQIEGALSSDVRIAQITVADRQGVWLTIEGAHLIWSRLALLSRRLDIDLLEARSITITRRPLPPAGLQPASSGFSLPELPVSVRLTKLEVPVVSIDKSIAGEDTTLAVAGGGQFADGTLAAELAVERTKPQGGRLFVKANYADATRLLDLNLKLEEPKDGLVSNLLDLPGRPALSFSVVGSGPIDRFVADVGLSADGDKLLSGKATLTQGEAGIDFAADLTGSLGRLVPPAYADFFAGTSSLSLATRRLPDGGMALDKATIRSGVIALDLSGAISADGFPTEIRAEGRLGAADGKPVLLPGSGGARVASASFDAALAEGGWKATFDLADLVAGRLRAGKATIEASGEAENLKDAAARRVTFEIAGKAQDLASDDEAMARALGKEIELAAKGRWQAGQPVAIDEIRFANANASARFVGRLAGNDLDGTYTLKAPDLAVFAGLVDSDLRGGVDLTAQGKVAVIGGAFSLALDGRAQDLGLGVPALDPLLAGQTALTGRVARDPEGLAFDAVHLANPALDARLDGRFGVKAVDLKAVAQLADIRVVTDRASGVATLTATLKGDAEAPTIEATVSAPRLSMQGKVLSAAAARFSGTLPAVGPNGVLTVSGDLSGLPVQATATIASTADGTRSLSNLDARVGAATLAGNLALAADSLAAGRLALDAPDLAEVAPLLLLRASGRISADIGLSADDGRQNAIVKADAARLTVETISIGSGRIDLAANDLFGVPALAGTIDARSVKVGGFEMTRLQASANQAAGGATGFRAEAELPRGRASTEGSIRPAQGGFDLSLARLDLKQDSITAALASPVTIASRPSGVTIPKAVLRIGQGGTLAIAGTVGDEVDLSVDIAQLPAALANAASPQLGASGTIAGSARIRGTSSQPTAEFDLTGANLTANAAKSAGLPPLQLAAKGSLARNVVTLSASAKGAGGIGLTATGQVPLAGPGLSLTVKGAAPLAVANRVLSERGARLTGTANIDARVTGALQSPHVDGGVTISGATFTDPETGMQLTAIAGRLRFDGDSLAVERLTATTPGRGTLGVSGSMSLKGDLPLDLAVTLRNARVSDGRIVTAQLSGDVTVRGPALGQPTLAGRINVERAEVTIPERFASNAALLGVRHLSPPPEVRATLARLRNAQARGSGGPGGRATGIVLDLTIDAPSRIFVRGRGIDAELGGQVRLTGPVANLSPVGAFKLRRGALSVIGQRINLDSGEVRLMGDLDPEIDFIATTRTTALVVTAQVTGRASDPQIVLSSVPELPQDEVLAHFLFGHSISDLSPFQIVQLATAVAQLAGGQGGDLLSSIRKSTGLDNLSIVTDSKGNAAVQAGRYINERMYFGVTTGVTGNANATINLDVTRNLKARVEAGSEGGKAGIFYEREY